MTRPARIRVITAVIILFLVARAGHPPRQPVPAGPVVATAPPAIVTIPEAVRQRILRSQLVELPRGQRAINWSVGTFQNGSCMWASLMNLLRWQGRSDLADWIPQHHGGAASGADLIGVLDQAGCDWAAGSDVAFLEWACRTRRGAIVDWGGNHVVNLVGLDAQHAWLMDNTGPLGQQIIPYDRTVFLNFWTQSGAGALTPIAGEPTPPAPWLFSWEDEL